MSLDVRTLIFCDLVITGFLALALLFFRSTQKTYAGFNSWTAGTVALVVGYFAVVLRGTIPVGVSILLANAAFGLGALLRLDGALRFVLPRKLPWGAYLTVPALVAANAWFYWIRDDLLMRSVIIAAFAALVSVLIALAFLRKSGPRNPTHVAFGLLNLAYGLALTLHVALWLASPHVGMFESAGLHVVLYGSVTVIEAGAGISFFMVNVERMAQELGVSQVALQSTVQELQTAVSQVKVLSGLLPICSHCKNVRDDQGYWQHVEVYVKERSEAEFSHSICPSCVRKHYPDLADEVLGELG